jgi:hypothetical protein
MNRRTELAIAVTCWIVAPVVGMFVMAWLIGRTL